jgi:hypothetical protein
MNVGRNPFVKAILELPKKEECLQILKVLDLLKTTPLIKRTCVFPCELKMAL